MVTAERWLLAERWVSPRDAASVLAPLLQDELAEVFVILCLTTKQRLIGSHEVRRGTLDATPAHPREVFRAAIPWHARIDAVASLRYVTRELVYVAHGDMRGEPGTVTFRGP